MKACEHQAPVVLNIYGRQSMAMAASIYNPSASFPAGGWAVLFLDAGQQIIRAALLPRVQYIRSCCMKRGAYRSLLQRSREQDRDAGERQTERQTDRQTASARKRERCWLQADGDIVSDS